MIRLLTDEQDAYLRSIVKGKTCYECADLLNEKFKLSLTGSQISGYKKSHHITSGLDTRIKKGYIPKHKGTKGLYNVGGNITSFKKGHTPKNIAKIGVERKTVDGYTWVKTSDSPNPKTKRANWTMKHVLVYEQAHGKLKDGCMCVFLDGNKENFDIDNIVSITKAESLYMNKRGLFSTDPEITKSGIALARMMCKAFKAKRRREERRTYVH